MSDELKSIPCTENVRLIYSLWPWKQILMHDCYKQQQWSVPQQPAFITNQSIKFKSVDSKASWPKTHPDWTLVHTGSPICVHISDVPHHLWTTPGLLPTQAHFKECSVSHITDKFAHSFHTLLGLLPKFTVEIWQTWFGIKNNEKSLNYKILRSRSMRKIALSKNKWSGWSW